MKRPLMLFREHQSALDQAIFFAQFAEPGDICFCVGAGGAGKTSLAQILGPMLYGEQSSQQPGTKPFILVSLDAADRAYFSSKDFIRSCLLELRDPFRSRVEDVSRWELAPEIKRRLVRLTSLHSSRSHGEPEMRAAFVNLAKMLGVKLLIIDEANMLRLTQKTRVPTDYLESLRRLGDKAGCSIILFGTIDLLGLLGHSAQLNRRTSRIHIARMSCRDECGAIEFTAFLKGIEIDYSITPGLLTEQRFAVHELTYGIPGEIVGLVKRAKMTAGAEGVKLEWKHVSKAGHLPMAWKQMITEADLIESTMEDTSSMPDPRADVAHPKRKIRMKPRRTANSKYSS